MAAKKAKVSPAQRLTGYGILAALGLISIWLLVQQGRFNPAVVVAQRAPLTGKTQTAAGAQSATAGLIPDVEGFSPLAPAESFGPDKLSDKIDGKAELYLSAGFKEMACRSFGLGTGGETHVEVYLYDMGSPANAYAVFSSQRRRGSRPSSLTGNAYSTDNALFFTQERYYVEIVVDRAAPTLQDSLGSYAKALLAKLPSEGKPKEVDTKALFPKEGLAADTVRLCSADCFSCEGLNNIFTGEYSLKSGKATAFIARHDTPEHAQADAKRYLDFLTANGYQKVQTPAASATLALFSLDNSFEVVFVQGKIMAGVHDATSQEAALELAAKLQNELKGKP